MLALSGWVLVVSLHLNDGRLVYALDDPYIHMAMAKHLVEDGVWGVTRHGFSSSSSSPLWVLILAGAYLTAGVRDAVPLAVNVLSAIGVLLVTDLIIRRHVSSLTARTAALIATVLFVPLVPMVFTGMEHVTHALIATGVLYLAARTLDTGIDRRQETRSYRWLALLTPVLTSLRYEGALMVAVVASLLVVRGRRAHAAAVAALGALPIVLYGLVSLANGWMFLPNPILLKGAPHGASASAVLQFLTDPARLQVFNPHVLAITVALAGGLWLQIRRRGV